MWTSFALNAEGDYATTRTALDFISKFQREDGKVPHEISQSASLVPWFKDYPYAYVSADATPLFIIAMNDYAVQSGDVAFAREKWDNFGAPTSSCVPPMMRKASRKMLGVGHGWVEGGPLLPVKNEYYQAGLAVEALHALSNLARLARQGRCQQATRGRVRSRSKPALDQAFWSPENQGLCIRVEARQPARRRSQRADDGSHVVRLVGPESRRPDHHATGGRGSPDGLGHADHFPAIESL